MELGERKLRRKIVGCEFMLWWSVYDAAMELNYPFFGYEFDILHEMI